MPKRHPPARGCISRRLFLSSMGAAGLALLFTEGPLIACYARMAAGKQSEAVGYGPLVNKGELWLPADFNYQVISRQGKRMSDGNPTPGIFDGMGAFRGEAGSSTTILIRNHENCERMGEIKVITSQALEYDEQTLGGNTKLVVTRAQTGHDPVTGQPLYEYTVVRDFAILGGTSTNCAGGIRHPHSWLTCEEVVKRSPNAKKHGYIFEIDARADAPVPAIPVPQCGRFCHEAAVVRSEIVYLSEDRDLQTDPILGTIGACLYRYMPHPGGSIPLAETTGVLQALKLKNEFHANMDIGRVVGVPYPVEWVTVDEPDHEDDTDNRRDRVRGFTPTRIQAQDKGAAYFDRQEGMWCGPGDHAKVYFDCTSGGAHDLGQVWAYDPDREVLTLVYESEDPEMLQRPDNMVIVPQTSDIFLCEDRDGEEYVRGLSQDGLIYNFAGTTSNETELCGICFAPDGQTLYLNQQGNPGELPDGPAGQGAVTYAIYGPFEKRISRCA